MVYGWFGRWFEERCPACDGTTRAGFCAVCASSFVAVGPACGRCGLALPVAGCPLLGGAWHVESVVAPLAYVAPLDFYLQGFKYRGQRALARAFALLLAPAARTAGSRIDALVAVPLHRSRLAERGYNQAFELARHLGRELGVPVLTRGIARRAADASQTRRGARARLAGMAGAFVVRRSLTARRIAIVDDVITTGATVNALAAELRGAGAASCVAWAIARTPERATQPRKV